MPAADLTLNVTEFKAKSLKLFDQLSRGEIGRITVTKRGRPVATVSAHDKESRRFEDVFGCMAGTATIAPGTDLTAPMIDEDWGGEMLKDWDEQNC